jgi:MoxR-like ATPase
MNKEILTEEDAGKGQMLIKRLHDSLNTVLFGQSGLTEMVVVCVLSRGHLLLEGLPGLGKTELVKGLARSIALESKRIQFTPDLLPGDITGSPMLKTTNGSTYFEFQRGPLFANIVLADEINRASPKTQSALLEAMQERSVTVMGIRHSLPEPFFVLATQNPIELEGTYPLPEAQLDRFLFKLEMTNQPIEVLEQIIREREMGMESTAPQVLQGEELAFLMNSVRRVYLPEVIINYIARVVDGTHLGRSNAAQGVKYGASPRAALGIAAAARARALSRGKINVSFEDVLAVTPGVLSHRIILDYSARIQGKTPHMIVRDLLEEIPRQEFDVGPLISRNHV